MFVACEYIPTYNKETLLSNVTESYNFVILRLNFVIVLWSKLRIVYNTVLRKKLRYARFMKTLVRTVELDQLKKKFVLRYRYRIHMNLRSFASQI